VLNAERFESLYSWLVEVTDVRKCIECLKLDLEFLKNASEVLPRPISRLK
jgi:hypothetical protein